MEQLTCARSYNSLCNISHTASHRLQSARLSHLSVGAVSLSALATLEQVSGRASSLAHLGLSDSLLCDGLTKLLQFFTSYLLQGRGKV